MWRFYGTEADPGMGYSVSRIHFPDGWCSENERIAVFSPHPHDAGRYGGQPPWAATKGTNDRGEPWFKTGPSGANPDGWVTTQSPFRLGGARCTELITDQSQVAEKIAQDEAAQEELRFKHNQFAWEFGCPIRCAGRCIGRRRRRRFVPMSRCGCRLHSRSGRR